MDRCSVESIGDEENPMPAKPRYFAGTGIARRSVHKDQTRKGSQFISTICIATTAENADRIARALTTLDAIQEAILPVIMP
jgi:hypothetical protein